MHPNEERLRRGYEAFAAGDMDAIREMFADDIVWRVSGRNPLAGEYRGQDQVFDFFAKLMQVSGGTFRVEVLDVLANDQRAVAITRTRVELAGEALENTGVGVYEIGRDGKTKEASFFTQGGDVYRDDELLTKAAKLAGVSA